MMTGKELYRHVGPGDPDHDEAKRLMEQMEQIEQIMIGATHTAFRFVVYDMLRWMIDEIEGDDDEQRRQRQDERLADLFDLMKTVLESERSIKQ